MNARSYLNVYVKRGKIQRGPCVVCGLLKVEAHHYNGYDHPLDVVWLCPQHHRAVHPHRNARISGSRTAARARASFVGASPVPLHPVHAASTGGGSRPSQCAGP